MEPQQDNDKTISFADEFLRRRVAQRHDYSRVAGKLFAVFELLCTVVRETQELAEDNNEPIMREIGGIDVAGDEGLLRDAISSVAIAAKRALEAAEPEEWARIRSARKQP